MGSTEPYRGDPAKAAKLLGEEPAAIARVAQGARVFRQVAARTGLLGGHRAPGAPVPAAQPVPAAPPKPLTEERRDDLQITASRLLRKLPSDNQFRLPIERTFYDQVRAATTDDVALAALKTLRNSVDAEVARLARLNS